MIDPDLRDEGPDWEPIEPSDLLAELKAGRCDMLLLAILVLGHVKPPELMEPALEVLRAAVADLGEWEKGMAEVLKRDAAISLGEVSQH